MKKEGAKVEDETSEFGPVKDGEGHIEGEKRSGVRGERGCCVLGCSRGY